MMTCMKPVQKKCVPAPYSVPINVSIWILVNGLCAGDDDDDMHEASASGKRKGQPVGDDDFYAAAKVCG